MTRSSRDGSRSPAEPPTTELAPPAAVAPAPSTSESPAPPPGDPRTGPGDGAPRTGPLPAVPGTSVPAVGADAGGGAPPPVEPPPVPTSGASVPGGKAGRDLKSAIAVGLGLGAVIVGSLLVYRPAFLAVVTAAVLVAVVELSRALQTGTQRPPLVPVLVGALAMELLAWTRGATGLVIAFLFTVLAVPLWRLAPGPVGYLRDAATGVLVALYVPLLAGFAVLLLVPDDGVARVLLFIATVVCNDVGGYAAGVLAGKHSMAPSISPKKSWEGLGGSVLACIAVATPIMVFTFHRPWWGGLVFGMALTASATIGDLGASLVKRDLGIKDYSQLLPGHGGIMDRLDSLLPSAAVAFLLLSALAPV